MKNSDDSLGQARVKFSNLAKWQPPANLEQLWGFYSAFNRASDAFVDASLMPRSRDIPALEDWSEALGHLVMGVVAAAAVIKPETGSDLMAKRSILMDWHQRCGDEEFCQIETLSKLAQEAEEVRRKEGR